MLSTASAQIDAVAGVDRSLGGEVEQDPSAALLPQLHRLGAMLPDMGEPEGGEGT